jgi:AcrR family transcriptional regulator
VNRAALVDAARDALGYEAVGVRDIVRRTGVASGTFYNYFPDQEAVLGAEVRFRVRAARAGAWGSRSSSRPASRSG